MASGTPTPDPASVQSYTEMKGDVEAIGAHCQMAYCHVLDFLPFRCESCKGYVVNTLLVSVGFRLTLAEHSV